MKHTEEKSLPITGVALDKITIVGMGLIGGSLGMALVGKGFGGQIWGVDVNPSSLEIAAQTAAGHRFTTNLAEGVQDADLVVLATPVGKTTEILQAMAGYLKPGCIITDVGSVKGAVVKAAVQVLPPEVSFIGGHPMAGSEVAGINGADRYLFENAVYVLTPTEETPPYAVEAVRRLAEAVGARVVFYPPGEHDLLVAGVSHLPHLVAAALVNTVGGLQEENHPALMLAAGGFRDTTRIASGQALMWRDIFLTNREATLELIQRFKKAVGELESAITAGAGPQIESLLNRARITREQVPAKMKGYLPSLHEIIVTVPDRPGMIADIATYLGQEGININDIEILRVREGDGGTIRLGVSTGENLHRALKVLRSNGIIAKEKQ